MTARPRVAVVGAGIAGASAGFALADRADVVLLEREPAPGYHSTGRSAAVVPSAYGSPAVRALTRASRGFLAEPPSGFAEVPLLAPLGDLVVARADQLERLDAFFEDAIASEPDLQRLDGRAARARAPWLDPGYVAAAVYGPAAVAIDVGALHEGFLRGLRARGGRIVTDARLAAIERSGGGWRLATGGGRIEADVLVDAAGAWAEQVAALAGIAPLGLVPMRRTAVLIAPPDGADPTGWPMVDDVGGAFYAKPDAGWLLVSPEDETPVEPQDVQPEEFDVAVAIDRFERASGRPVTRVGRRWAGLRTFAPDRDPVVGPDPDQPRFFWLAGQGGFGIMTAPALARGLAGLVLDGRLPDDLSPLGAAIGPARLRARRPMP